MKFEFAKYTDVTELAFKSNPAYKENGIVRVFLCPDVHCVWLARVVEGFNEEYEPCEDSWLVERNQIDNDVKGKKLGVLKAVKLLKEDSFENWDYHQFDTLEDAIESLDDGFGILA